MNTNQFVNSMSIYGKIPCLGDFINRQLSTELVDWWHSWIMGGMLLLHNHNYQELFLNTPIWNFMIPATQDSRYVKLGAITPSMDRVKRLYPLMITLHIPASIYNEHTIYVIETFYRQINTILSEKNKISSLLDLTQINILIKDTLYHLSEKIKNYSINKENIDIPESNDIMNILNLGHDDALEEKNNNCISYSDICDNFNSEGINSHWFTYNGNTNEIKNYFMSTDLDTELFNKLFFNKTL